MHVVPRTQNSRIYEKNGEIENAALEAAICMYKIDIILQRPSYPLISSSIYTLLIKTRYVLYSGIIFKKKKKRVEEKKTDDLLAYQKKKHRYFLSREEKFTR